MNVSDSLPASVKEWVTSVAKTTRPDRIHVCDGSEEENNRLLAEMTQSGVLLPLKQETFPGCFLHRSHPSDVARTEHLTFICSDTKEEAGPTNNWMSPQQAQEKVWPLFRDAMQGRTLYVIPYLMGPDGSPMSRVGVEITDSPYVVANMRIMTRIGPLAFRHLDRFGGEIVKGLHSLGDLSPERRYICHFPKRREIWSIGSGMAATRSLAKNVTRCELPARWAATKGGLPSTC